MSKRSAISFTRRGPDNITEELIAVLSSKASFEFKPLFEIMLLNLRERNAASGGEEMLRLRAYEKLQGIANQGAVKRTVTGITKKYKGIATRMVVLRAEMKALRAACNQRARAKAAALNCSLTSVIGFRGTQRQSNPPDGRTRPWRARTSARSTASSASRKASSCRPTFAR